MKLNNNKIIFKIIVCCSIICFLVCHFVNNSIAQRNDIYDVVLFWGQSNMVGYCGVKQNECVKDIRFDSSDSNEINKFSRITGIDANILSCSKQENWIQIKPETNTAYEYMYLSDSLKPITEETEVLGEKLKYNLNTNELELSVDKKFSIQQSYGTNIIPQFCKTYYEKTGHKVIVVFASP